MKEKDVNEELLEAVSGGDGGVIDSFSFINAMNQVDGKRCKYCGKVFSSNEILNYHKSELLTYNRQFLSYNKEMLPCLSCGRWRYVATDFK